MDNRNFVRSRKRFKVYTWKYKKTITPIASFILLVNQIFGYILKSISYFYLILFIINSDMNVIPDIIKEHGWIKLIIINLLICVLCSISSMMLLKSITMIPHNNNFDQRIEYNTLVKYYLNDYNFKIISLLHYIGDFIAIICGIILFSKLIDILLIKLFGFTLLLQLYPKFNLYKINYGMLINNVYNSVSSTGLAGGLLNNNVSLSEMLPWSDGRLVFGITLGYVICTLICINLTNSSLQETAKLQITTFFILLLSLVLLFVYIILGNFHSGNSLMKNGSFEFNKLNKDVLNLNVNNINADLNKLDNNNMNYNITGNKGNKNASSSRLYKLDVMVSIMLIFVDNYKLTSILPSWANEMKNNVNPTVIVWLTNGFGFVFYILLSVLFNSPNDYFTSQLDIDGNTNTNNLLNIDNIILITSKFVGNGVLNKSILINASIILFILVTSIPDIIFGCISTRYNLLNLGYLNSNNSYFWGCVFPFLFTWLLLNETLFSDLLNNLGLMSALICDFLIPIVLYIISYNLYDRLYSTSMDGKNKETLYKRISLIVIKRLSDMNTNIHRLLFPSSNRGMRIGSKDSISNKNLAKQSSNFSIFTSLLSKYSILSNNMFVNKFTKSISSNFSKSVSCNFARSISSKFTNSFSNKFLKSISLDFANSFSNNRFARSISSNFSNRFVKSISSNFSKSVSCNFARRVSKLSNTQEILLDSLHKDSIGGIELNGGVLERGESKLSYVVNGNDEGVNGNTEQENPVDYKSFKIIRNSKELNKTQDEIFNRLNRPSYMLDTKKTNESQLSNGSGSYNNENMANNVNNNDENIDKEELEGYNNNRNKDRDLSKSDEKSHSSKNKHKNERLDNKIVVFPGVLFKYHLVIAKVMVVFFSSLIVLPPILYLYNLLG